MSLARNLSKFKPSSSGLVETADIADDAVSTDQIANNAVINTSGAVTTTGAFTSVGIDDNADATAITITSDEAVGIGKSLTPNNYSGYQSLTIGGSDATTGATVDLEDSSGNLEGRINGTNGIVYIEADPNGSTGASKISLEVDGSAKMTVLDGGDVNIANGNLVIGTSGKGIDFSATGDGFVTAGSEVLTDYERGAYNLSFNGFVNQTVSQGYYVKVGQLCYVTTFLHANGSQNSSNFTCNLPFTPASHSASNNSGYYIGSIGPVMHYRVDTGSAGMVSYVTAGTATFRLYEVNADGDWVWMQNNAFTSEDQAWISFTYVTAT
jgi:hypothetical protein